MAVKLTEFEVVEALLDSLSLLSLVSDLSSEEITGGDELPLEVLSKSHRVLLLVASWWSHEEDAAHY